MAPQQRRRHDHCSMIYTFLLFLIHSLARSLIRLSVGFETVPSFSFFIVFYIISLLKECNLPLATWATKTGWLARSLASYSSKNENVRFSSIYSNLEFPPSALTRIIGQSTFGH